MGEQLPTKNAKLFLTGFSTVSKKWFYSNVRDSIYFETSITNNLKKL